MPHARMMTEVQGLARFVARVSLRNTSADGIQQLTIRVLDTLGVIIAARQGTTMRAIRRVLDELGGAPSATLVGGPRASATHAAFYHAAAVGYADFADAYVAPDGGVTQPSEHFGAVLAAAECADASGAELMAALAVAYEVHVRLIDAVGASTRYRFDPHTITILAATAGTARALRLSERQIANAMAIAASANVTLRVTHTGPANDWACLAGAHAARAAVFAALLARRGITGPEGVIEGPKGLREAVTGPFQLDWPKLNLEALRRTTVRQHAADPRWQSALEAAADLRGQAGFHADTITSVRLRTFAAASVGEDARDEAIGGRLACTLACMLLTGDLANAPAATPDEMPENVRNLAQHVAIIHDPQFDARFPQHMPAALEVRFADGGTLQAMCDDAAGSPARPWAWDTAVAKFERLASPHMDELLRKEIVSIVHGLEHHKVSRLTEALAKVPRLAE